MPSENTNSNYFKDNPKRIEALLSQFKSIFTKFNELKDAMPEETRKRLIDALAHRKNNGKRKVLINNQDIDKRIRKLIRKFSGYVITQESVEKDWYDFYRTMAKNILVILGIKSSQESTTVRSLRGSFGKPPGANFGDSEGYDNN